MEKEICKTGKTLREKGATMVEYGIIVALIIVLSIVFISTIGQKTSQGFSQVASGLG